MIAFGQTCAHILAGKVSNYTHPSPSPFPNPVHIENRHNIQSSVTCRQRKVKCNEERPICGPCAKSSRDCVFSDCIFRHYSASDLAANERGFPYPEGRQTWVKIPSDRKLYSCSSGYCQNIEGDAARVD